MKAIRVITGLCALLGLTIAVNVLLLNENLFSWTVLLPLTVGAISGLAWLVCRLVLFVEAQERGKALRGLNLIVSSVLFLGICIAVYAFAKHLDLSWDLTREGRRELSEQTVQVLESLKEDVDIICLFLNTGVREEEIAKEKTVSFLERCAKHTPRITWSFMDPQLQEEALRHMGITRSARQGSLVIRCGTRQKTLLLTGTPPRLEERTFTDTLINVTRSSNPKVCFLAGHGDLSQLRVFRNLLKAESYRPEDTAIRLAAPSLPDDCDILVIAAPESNLDPREIEVIQRFLDGGGRMLVLADVMRAQGGGKAPRPVFFTWLQQRYGIVVGEDLIFSRINDRFGQLDLVPDTATVDIFRQYDVADVEFHGCYSADHDITRNFNELMSISGARSVTLLPELPRGTVGVEILHTLPYAWAEKRWAELFDDPNAGKPVRDADELYGSVSLAVAVTSKTDVPVGDSGMTRDARIVVVGDSDIAVDESVLAPGHLNFLLNTMAWLSENEELIAIRPTTISSPPILLTETDEKVIAWTATLGLFQAAVLAGLIAFAFRRKYQ